MTDKSIAHYRVLGELGRGGMGLVYKAEDTRLDRTVALKVLPGSALVTDEDRSRFYREARAAASLHHPNIATVFEIDEYDRGGDSGPYIAMEFVDGETLADRIASGPMPLDEVISIGSSIATALKAAHDKGIVHRDVKSGNIMLTSKDEVKVLDFGLAKLSESSLLTQQGTTLGTIAYMSPEQARGKGIDHQTDIWSLGVVLYEMIAGRLPFQGDYSEATIYAILHDDPQPLTAIRTGVPMDLERVVFKCLAKDKSLRYQNVDEIPADLAAVDLDAPTSTAISAYLSTRTQAAQPAPVPSRTNSFFIAAAGLLLAAIAAAAGWFSKPDPEPLPRPVTRFAIELPPEQQILPMADTYSAIAISQDGQHMVYLGGSPLRLYWRRLDSLEPVPLAGTEGAARPFFSPDGARIAFYGREVTSALYTLELGGGAPIRLTNQVSQSFRDAVWLADDAIYFTDRDCEVSRISPRGGTVEKVVERLEEEVCLALLLTNHSDDYLLLRTEGKTIAVDLDSGDRVDHTSGGWHYIKGGYYAYMDLGSFDSGAGLAGVATTPLLIAPLDLVQMELLDRPILVEGGSLDYGHVAFSAEGTFVHLKSSRRGEMVWIDRDGSTSSAATDVASEASGYPSISPDGRRIALSEGAPSTGRTLRVIDRRTHRSMEMRGGSPVWSPDGRWLVYTDCTVSYPECTVLRTSANLSRRPDTLVHQQSIVGTSMSPDARYLILANFGDSRQAQLTIYDFETGTSSPLLDQPGIEFHADFSPDGRWVSYVSNQSGEYRVFVAPFTESPETSYQITRESSSPVVWSRDRPEMYYMTRDGMMMARYETEGETFSVTSEELLFEIEGAVSFGFDYDPSSDRFLVSRSDPTVPDSIIVVRNWIAEVEAAYR